jgi:hypothetical protein
MVLLTKALGRDYTLMIADAGYHNENNLETLRALGVPAMIADNQLRLRDEQFANRARHKGRVDPLHQKRPTDDPNKPKLLRPRTLKLSCTSTVAAALRVN